MRVAHEGGSMSQLTVLVVDDDPALLRAFARSFGRRYRILSASSGAEALRTLAAQAVDVVVVDYSMPVMSGAELLRRVVADHPDVGRVMLTAYADLPELSALKATELVSAILAKPWDAAEVEAAVARAFQLVSMRRAVRLMRSGVERME